MTTTIGSWALFAVSAFGLWLTGRHLKAGWWFAISNQILMWAPYSLLTHQYGLVANSAVFVAIYAHNLWRWRHSVATAAGARPDRAPCECRPAS
jgi:hypothetical protein